MLTHIVWWTMKSEAEGKSAAENAALIKSKLEGLRGRIPALKDLTIGTKILPSTTEETELTLVTRHDDAAGLAEYAAHPEHQEALALIQATTASRRAIDFEE